MRSYDPEIGEQLIALVADGHGLQGASEKLGIPRRSARSWEASVPEFAAALGAARREALENIAEELIALADQVANCGEIAVVQAQKLRIDTRRWVLSKLRPERYGDHLQLTGSGDQPLIPANRSEAAIPKLMSVLTVLLPQASNSELHQLATTMASKLQALEGPGKVGNGEDEGH